MGEKGLTAGSKLNTDALFSCDAAFTGDRQHQHMTGVACMTQSVMPSRIGFTELLLQKCRDSLPANLMRLHIAVLSLSNGGHLLLPSPSLNQTHGMVLRDNSIVFGKEHQGRCRGQAREAQRIEAVFEQKLCCAV